MERYQRFNLAAALLAAALVQLAPASGTAAASKTAAPPSAAPCDMRVRVELTPDMPQPLDAGFVNSLLSKHSAFRLTLRQQDAYNPSVIGLDLAGPGPEAACREVVNSMRKDSRVVSVDVQQDADSTAPPVSAPRPLGGAPSASTAQPRGTVQAGPDGGWILEPLNAVSYVQAARDRYECDIAAVDQTGFDPTKYEGGVPPDALPGKRAAYLRAEAACFQARGYVVR
jgi:hypothetical protein